jgi:HEAT repeat protein
MSKQTRPRTDLESLLDTLESDDGATRQKARTKLVALGKTAVPRLTRALQHSGMNQVRWEAAKALGAIGDPGAIPALVKALEDSDPDVAWLAAEGLRKFKKGAWPPLLRVLLKHGPESTSLRQGAHHVLRNQRAHGFNDLLATLSKALESGALPESATVAAYNILKRMRGKP